MILSGRDAMGETLETRRGLLEGKVLSRLEEPIRYRRNCKRISRP
jgi:hypothetical protein